LPSKHPRKALGNFTPNRVAHIDKRSLYNESPGTLKALRMKGGRNADSAKNDKNYGKEKIT